MSDTQRAFVVKANDTHIFYAFRCVPQREAEAAETLRLIGAKAFVPMREVIKRKSRKRTGVRSALAVMTGYVLVGFRRGEGKPSEDPAIQDQVYAVMQSPLVSQPVGLSEWVSQISSKEVLHFLEINNGVYADKEEFEGMRETYEYAQGDSVVIVDSTFADVEGTIEAIDENGQWVKVVIPLFNSKHVVTTTLDAIGKAA